MSLIITKKDITKFKCDALVNPVNCFVKPTNKYSHEIMHAGGKELRAECEQLSFIEIGSAQVTKAYHLHCKYILHTALPTFDFYKSNALELIEECYSNILDTANSHNFNSIAIPFLYVRAKFTKRQFYDVAIKTITKFLQHSDITVYLTGNFNKHLIDNDLNENIKDYILHEPTRELHPYMLMSFAPPRRDPKIVRSERRLELSIERILKNIDDSFAITLFKLIDAKHMTDVQCYKGANVSKQTWYKILNEKTYKPNKNTVISFAISLQLNYQETQHLLATVGYTLSSSSEFDLIIKYCIEHRIYNILEINEILYEFDQVCLGG